MTLEFGEFTTMQAGGTAPAGRDAPVRTVIRQNREEGVEPLQRREFPTTLVTSLVVAAVVLAAVAWWINRRAARSMSPEVVAQSTLARRLRLGRRAGGLLHELETASGVPALAMLASATALRTALEAPEARQLAGRPGWARLEALAAARSEGA